MKALIIVDAQLDFMPGGALPVTDGNKIVPVINELIKQFDIGFCSMDWHPADHCSFQENGGEWPRHCVQGTPGSLLHPDIILPNAYHVVQKGTSKDEDCYSAFGAASQGGISFIDIIQKYDIDEMNICGLATDYCVKHTAADSIQAGYKTVVRARACRGVELEPGNVVKALDEMKALGITISDE